MDKNVFPVRLKSFKGYTVDFRLRQFRKVNKNKDLIEFINFNSNKGEKLLKEYRKFISEN